MAGTLYSSLIAAARFHLNASRTIVTTPGVGTTPPVTAVASDPFWADTELLNIAVRGTTDLWAAIMDLDQGHFQTIDTTDVSLQANATQLSGVPNDVFRIDLIEPVDTTSLGPTSRIAFVPRAYNHREFINARALTARDPTTGVNIFYCLSTAGPPAAAPIILTAPVMTATILCRLVYVPVLGGGSFGLGSINPIPGESDHALIAWTVAYARARERDDHSPDPAWLAVYATEKASLVTRLTPRQTQEMQVASGVFDDYWSH